MVWFLLMIFLLLLLVGLNVPIAVAIGFPAVLVLLITGVPQVVVPLTNNLFRRLVKPLG